MGTLFEQKHRTASLSAYAKEVKSVAHNMGLDPDNLTPAEWHAACDVLRTGLAIQNADVLDEQLAGFGKILIDLVEAIQMLKGDSDE
jgi:hypothetical protein